MRNTRTFLKYPGRSQRCGIKKINKARWYEHVDDSELILLYCFWCGDYLL